MSPPKSAIAHRLAFAGLAACLLLAASPAASATTVHFVLPDLVLPGVGANAAVSVTIDCASPTGTATTTSFPEGIYAAVAVGACEFRTSCDVSTGYFRVDCGTAQTSAPTCDVRMDDQCLLSGGAGQFYHETGPVVGRFVDTHYPDNSGTITVYFVRIPS